MHIRQLLVDLLDHIHGEHFAIGLAGELVGAVGGAHGDGERIDLGGLDEFHGFIRIGQQLVMAQLAFGAVAVFLVAHASLQRAQHAQLALHGDAAHMGDVHHALGDAHVVVIIGGGGAVGLQRAVHHDRGEAGLDRGHAGGLHIAVVQMHADRNMRIHFRQRVHHVAQHDVIGVGAGAARGLDDDGRIQRIAGFADGEGLFHVIDVECRNAVAMFGGVVEQLTKGDAGHEILQCGRRAGALSPKRSAPRRPAAACPRAIRGKRRLRSRYR